MLPKNSKEPLILENNLLVGGNVMTDANKNKTQVVAFTKLNVKT